MAHVLAGAWSARPARSRSSTRGSAATASASTLPSSPEIFGRSGLSRLDGDVLATAGVTHAILLEGTNDLGQTPPATAAQIIAGLQQVVTRLQVSPVCGCTSAP